MIFQMEDELEFLVWNISPILSLVDHVILQLFSTINIQKLCRLQIVAYLSGFILNASTTATRAKVNRDSCSAKVYLPTTSLAISMALLHILC
jgi:hypothetical protein